MLNIPATKYATVQLLAAGAKADTAAATSAWTDISAYSGPIMIVANCGTVTAGQIAAKMRHATTNGGANAADITGASFTTVTTSNDPKSETVVLHNADSLFGFIAYVGTVTTGPVDLGVTMLACDPNVQA